MKKRRSALSVCIIISMLMIAACSTSEKGTSSSGREPPPSATNSYVKLPVKTYVPGSSEVTALRSQYSDVTPEKLNEGYIAYTQGACVNCHEAKDIYLIAEAQWKNIIDDMAQRAYISNELKDAVYKYVISIKATQPE